MKKYTREIIIGVLIALLLSVSYCSHNSQKITEGEKNSLKEQLKVEKDGVLVFRKEQKLLFDSIKSVDSVKDKRILELNQSTIRLEKDLKTSQKGLKQKKETFKNKTFEQLAKVFIESGYKDVTYTNNSVNLEKYSPIEILDDLAEGFACSEDLNTKNLIIKNKDEEIIITQQKVLSRDLMLASKQVETEKLDSALKLSEDVNKKSEKEIKKLKTKNFINRILVPIAFIGGGYLGIQLTK